MTHDELVKTIDSNLTGILAQTSYAKYLRALRDIVQLHHPKDTNLGYHICAAEKDNWAWKHCETIKIVQEALK